MEQFNGNLSAITCQEENLVFLSKIKIYQKFVFKVLINNGNI